MVCAASGAGDSMQGMEVIAVSHASKMLCCHKMSQKMEIMSNIERNYQATTCPQLQLTCVVPWKACSTSAALIWRILVDCIGDSFPDMHCSPALPSGLLRRNCVRWGKNEEPLL